MDDTEGDDEKIEWCDSGAENGTNSSDCEMAMNSGFLGPHHIGPWEANDRKLCATQLGTESGANNANLFYRG